MKKSLIKALIPLLLFTAMANAKIFWKHKIPRSNDVIKIINQKNRSPDSLNDEFNILVWNMYKGTNVSWPVDFRELTRNVDIIISQEFFLDENMSTVFTELNEFEHIMATSFYYKSETRTGVMTASRIGASAYDFTKSQYREPIVRTPKVILTSKYKITNGSELLVINIHAINFVTTRKLEAQLLSIKSQIKEHNGPIIFAGDFNVWTKKKTKMMRDYMEDLGLTEIKYDKFSDKRMKILNKPLDYIFYRDLTLTNAEILGDIEGADHKPLIATFRID